MDSVLSASRHHQQQQQSLPAGCLKWSAGDVGLELRSLELDLVENGSEQSDVNFVSFCPLLWQTSLLAVATGSILHVYKVPIDCELDWQSKDLTACQLVTDYRLSDGARVTDISWSSDTSLQAPVKMVLMVALSDGLICMCSFEAETGVSSVRVMQKGVFGASVHVASFSEQAACVGSDNVLHVFNMRQWEARDKKLLRTAGKFVRFVDGGRILVVELDGTVRAYDAESCRPLRSCLFKTALPLRVDFARDRLAVLSATTGEVNLYSADLFERPVSLRSETVTGCLQMALCPSEPWLAVANETGFSIQHTETGRLVQQSAAFGPPVRHLAWHHQQPILALAFGHRVQLFNLQ